MRVRRLILAMWVQPISVLLGTRELRAIKYLLLSNGQTDALRSSYPIAGVGRKAHISVGTFVRSFDGGPFQLYLFRVTHSITG